MQGGKNLLMPSKVNHQKIEVKALSNGEQFHPLLTIKAVQ